MARWHLIALGFSADEIKYRVRVGRRHPKHRGVYSVFEPAGEGIAALTGDRAEHMRQVEAAGRMMASDQVAVDPDVP